jgi:amino acid permease
MNTDKFDRQITGYLAGFFLPVVIALFIYVFSSGEQTLPEYLDRVIKADIVTHLLSLAVFPNIAIFLVFNRLDMLKATRGVLGITIFWAVVVFTIKFLG